MTSRIPLPRTALPGHRSPEAGFDEPFDMLAACHERVQRIISLTHRLCDQLAQNGWDDTAAQAATDVMRYFDQAAPLHHQDEELHVFPLLLAAPDADGLHAAVRRLQHDHLTMHTQWTDARKVLQRIQQATGTAWQPLAAQESKRLKAFAAQYAAHIELEEQLVYPAAQRQLSAPARQHMGQDMMGRRGVTITRRDTQKSPL